MNIVPLLILFLPRFVLAGEYDNRPYLYLDGKLLAGHVTAQVCNKAELYQTEKYDHLGTWENGRAGYYGIALGLTGEKEEKLKYWIMSQPENSIKPLELLTQALKQNDFNMLTALRTAYNVLAEFEADNKFAYAGKEKRNAQPIYSKLIDITGEQQMAKDGYRASPLRYTTWTMSTRGGKTSSWIHFLGAAAIAYDEGISKIQREQIVGWRAGKGNTVETMLFLEKGRDRIKPYADTVKRDLTGAEGAKFGLTLARNVLFFKAKGNCGKYGPPPEPYLSDRMDLFGPSYPLKPGEWPSDHEYSPPSQPSGTRFKRVE